jgi:hypothetical protein
MIKHKLTLHAGHQPRPEVNDFQVMHVIYRLDTIEYDPDSNTILNVATTGYRNVGLDNWDVDNRIPGADVTSEHLEQWIATKIDIENLKTINIANLKPLPK